MLVSTSATVSRSATVREQCISDDSISLSFQIDSVLYLKSPKSNPDAYNIKINGFTELIGDGIPAVLKRVERFEIPEDKQISNIEITCTCDTLDMRLSPAGLPKVDNLTYDSTNQENQNEIKPYVGIWPAECGEIIDTSIYRDRLVGSLAIYPLRYDYSSQKVILCKNLKITITFDDSPTDSLFKARGVNTIKHTITDDSYKSVFTINSFNELSGDETSAMRAIVLPGGGGSDVYKPLPYLLIITPREFSSQAQKLAMWRRRNGVHVKVISEDSKKLANPEYTKGLIEDFYYTEEESQYVLLMGEGNWIKPFEGKFPVNLWMGASIGYETCDYYTDFYFGCMDGEEDYESDLIIGRLPARTSAEMTAMVDKIIHYEGTDSNVPGADNRVDLIISEFGGKGTRDTDDFVPVAELICKYLPKGIQNKITKVYYADSIANPLKWNYNSIAGTEEIPVELRKPNFNWDGSPTHIMNQLNEGCHCVLFRGHGLIDQWGYLGFKGSHVLGLNNYDRLPVVFAITCLSGMFYHPDLYKVSPTSVSGNMSMAVRMLGSSQKGAVGYIGANRESLSGYNEYLAVGMYGAMYPQNHFSITVPGEQECNSDDLVNSSKKYLGQIFETGCNWMFNGYNESKTSYTYKYLRYNREIYHCLGDPSMRVNMNNSNNEPLNIVIENGQRISKSYRQIVLVNKTDNWVSIIESGYNKNLDELCKNYYVSFADELRTTILINDDSYNQGLISNSISSIDSDGDYYKIQYSSDNDEVIFRVYDIYGNLKDTAKGNQGCATLSKGQTIEIVTMEIENQVVDSRRVLAK